jgi:hypothetical protein
LWGAVAQKHKSVSLVEVTFQNNGEASVEIPLNTLTDAQLHGGSQPATAVPAVAMYWRVMIGGWKRMLASGWDKPIFMILPPRGKAQLRFVFPTSEPVDTFSLPGFGKVKVEKGS